MGARDLGIGGWRGGEERKVGDAVAVVRAPALSLSLSLRGLFFFLSLFCLFYCLFLLDFLLRLVGVAALFFVRFFRFGPYTYINK